METLVFDDDLWANQKQPEIKNPAPKKEEKKIVESK